MHVQERIFDAHFHIGAYGTQMVAGEMLRPIPPALDHVDGDQCAEYLVRHRLAGGVAVPTYLEDQSVAFQYNELLLQAVERHASLLGGFWVSPLPEVEPMLQETIRKLPHTKIRALKIASNTWRPYGIDPSGWPVRLRRNMEQIIETASDFGLIIHFHTGYLPGAQPDEFSAFMNIFGGAATYQLVHMGEAIAPAFRFVPLFIEWIKRGYDVFTDTSIVPGFAPHWLLEELDKSNLDVDRVFFATDTPWGRFPSEYAKVADLPIDDSTRRAILYENAAKAYRFGE